MGWQQARNGLSMGWQRSANELGWQQGGNGLAPGCQWARAREPDALLHRCRCLLAVVVAWCVLGCPPPCRASLSSCPSMDSWRQASWRQASWQWRSCRILGILLRACLECSSLCLCLCGWPAGSHVFFPHVPAVLASVSPIDLA